VHIAAGSKGGSGTPVCLVDTNLAVERLSGQIERPAAVRLLEALRRTSEAVTVGDWVHSKLGWGRIERIVSLASGAQVNWCAGKQSRYRIVVTLRPGEDSEAVTIDLESASADFSNPGSILTCAKCEGFSTQRMGLMEAHFSAAHKKEAKHGIVCLWQEGPLPLSSLEFTSHKPPDSRM
jgi:hypothetical protein